MYVKNYFYAIYLLLCMKMWKYVKVTVSNNCYCLTFCNQIQLFAHEINIDEIICWHFLCLYFSFFLFFERVREGKREEGRVTYLNYTVRKWVCSRILTLTITPASPLSIHSPLPPHSESGLQQYCTVTEIIQDTVYRSRRISISCDRNYTGLSIPWP